MIACGSGSLHRALETGGTPRWDRAGGCDLARSDLLPASSSSKLPSPRCFMGIDVLDFSKPIVLIGTCASSIFPPPLLVESFRLINYFFPSIVVVLPVVPVRLSRCLTRVLFASRWISEISLRAIGRDPSNAQRYSSPLFNGWELIDSISVRNANCGRATNYRGEFLCTHYHLTRYTRGKESRVIEISLAERDG